MDGRRDSSIIYDNVPDTITTYQLSGFALSPTLGLGVVNQPVNFLVRKKFYLVANLPYSIKRGEVALIQVTVFNFLGNDVTTDVTLFNKRDEIEFVEKASTYSKHFAYCNKQFDSLFNPYDFRFTSHETSDFYNQQWKASVIFG